MRKPLVCKNCCCRPYELSSKSHSKAIRVELSHIQARQSHHNSCYELSSKSNSKAIRVELSHIQARQPLYPHRTLWRYTNAVLLLLLLYITTHVIKQLITSIYSKQQRHWRHCWGSGSWLLGHTGKYPNIAQCSAAPLQVGIISIISTWYRD